MRHPQPKSFVSKSHHWLFKQQCGDPVARVQALRQSIIRGPLQQTHRDSRA